MVLRGEQVAATFLCCLPYADKFLWPPFVTPQQQQVGAGGLKAIRVLRLAGRPVVRSVVFDPNEIVIDD